MIRLNLILSLLFAVSFTCAAQLNNDSTVSISGQVVDENDEPLINAAIQLLDNNDKAVSKTVTDFDGNYLIRDISSNNMYTITSAYITKRIHIIKNIVLSKDTIINFKMQHLETKIYSYEPIRSICIPMINPDNPSPMNKTFNSYQIEKLAH